MAQPPVLVVPGLRNSGPDHWQSILERTHPHCERVLQDNWEWPTLGSWLNHLYAAVAQKPGCILVAHSLGCVLVAHALTRRDDLPVQAAMLVAPADVEQREGLLSGLSSFAPIPRVKLCRPSIVVASRTDPYIAINRARYFAEKWGASFVDLGDAGHINADSGHGNWPEGTAILSELAGEKFSVAV